MLYHDHTVDLLNGDLIDGGDRRIFANLHDAITNRADHWKDQFFDRLNRFDMIQRNAQLVSLTS